MVALVTYLLLPQASPRNPYLAVSERPFEEGELDRNEEIASTSGQLLRECGAREFSSSPRMVLMAFHIRLSGSFLKMIWPFIVFLNGQQARDTRCMCRCSQIRRPRFTKASAFHPIWQRFHRACILLGAVRRQTIWLRTLAQKGCFIQCLNETRWRSYYD